MLWLSLLVALIVAFDFDRLDSPRNIDLMAMRPGLLHVRNPEVFRLLESAVYVELMNWVFIAIFIVNAFLIGRALWRIARPATMSWRPGIGLRPLIVVAGLLLACDTMSALVREPDDVGFFVNLGAQRLRERHRLPYGDPLLTGSAGAAYGPLLYVAHLPFQLALSPTRLNAESPGRPLLGAESTYLLPPPWPQALHDRLSSARCVRAVRRCAPAGRPRWDGHGGPLLWSAYAGVGGKTPSSAG